MEMHLTRREALKVSQRKNRELSTGFLAWKHLRVSEYKMVQSVRLIFQLPDLEVINEEGIAYHDKPITSFLQVEPEVLAGDF